jgi:hypothetical protein
MLCRSPNVPGAGLLLPDPERLRSNCSIIVGGQLVATRMKVTVDECVSEEKVLGLPRRFESLHMSFPTPCWSMRVLRAVVQVPALSVFYLRKQVASGHAVASQFVGHDHTRHVLKALQQPAKEAFGGFAIPLLLHKNVEHHAILINRAPEIMQHALDANEHLIHVPLIPGLWSAAMKPVGEALAKFLAPTPYRFIGDDDASFGQKQFDIPQAEAEHVIEPDGVADDLGGEAMTVAGVRWRLHAANLAGLQPACQTRLP